MALPLIVGAGIAAGTGIANYIGQSSANEANRDIAYATNAQNMAMYVNNQQWQTAMSNSAYQRSVSDMRLAGLNPILAAQNGGASTPTGGGPAAVTGAPMQNEMSGVGDAVRVGKELKLADQAIKVQKAETDLKKTQEYATHDQTRNNAEQRKKLKLEQEQLRANIPAVKAEAAAASAEAVTRIKHAEIDAKAATLDATLNRVSKATGAVGNIFGAGKLLQGISNSAKQNRRHQRQSDMQYERHLHRQGMKGSSVR